MYKSAYFSLTETFIMYAVICSSFICDQLQTIWLRKQACYMYEPGFRDYKY